MYRLLPSNSRLIACSGERVFCGFGGSGDGAAPTTAGKPSNDIAASTLRAERLDGDAGELLGTAGFTQRLHMARLLGSAFFHRRPVWIGE